ncbi:hypothetical protein [Acidiphilium sp.]|uniref:hypothetical protein n=1 Tax=Acidiphilium sp. TaxID=527 RepID=UPI002583438D|nr:hypothetical protein [Acidiphilium sp.]
MRIADLRPTDLPRSPVDAVFRRMIASRDEKIAGLQDRILDLEERLRRQEARHALDAVHAAALARLNAELVWPDGPWPVRAVLPLARLIRRVTRR